MTTKEKIHRITFAACQVVGAFCRRGILPLFGNVHMNIAPIFIGAVLLLPGDLIDQLFPLMPDTLVLILTVLVSLGVWYGMLKVLRLDNPSVSK